MTDIKTLKDALGEIDQIGIVVPNLAPIREKMKKAFGAEPTRDNDIATYPNFRFHDDYISVRAHVIQYDLFNIDLEFIQPISGQCTWTEYLEQHGQGIHHIRFKCEDLDLAEQKLKELGGEVYAGSVSAYDENVRFSYLDTFGLAGCFVELVNKA